MIKFANYIGEKELNPSFAPFQRMESNHRTRAREQPVAYIINVERVMGIEPTSSAWKADALADVLHPHIKRPTKRNI